MLTAQSPQSLFHTTIRRCEDLNKAAALSKSIFDYAKRSHGAEDYFSLAKEIIGGGKIRICLSEPIKPGDALTGCRGS